MDFVELHFHLLPGVDDGPRTMDESLELARAAVADGTTTVVTTPHVHPDFITNPAEIAGRVGELTQQLRAADIDLEVLPGGELAYEMVGRLGPVELDHIAQGPPGRRWILLEGTLTGLDPDFTVAADRLRSWGFGVVVAHPERARQTTDTAAALDHELARGSVVQLTAGSLWGLNGEMAQATAMRLLRSWPSCAIASDAHGVTRPPGMRLAAGAMAAAGIRDPARFLSAGPRALLELGLSNSAVVSAV